MIARISPLARISSRVAGKAMKRRHQCAGEFGRRGQTADKWERSVKKGITMLTVLFVIGLAIGLQAQDCVSQWVYLGDDGKLIYGPDFQGNQIPDFSNVGYKSGIVDLPNVSVQAVLEPDPSSEDDGPRIQAAIDQLSSLALDQNGFRGAVLLQAGEYRIAGTLIIRASGIVLRGEGQDSDAGTVLRATGVRPAADASPLIVVAGSGSRIKVAGTEHNILDDYVPVGAHSFTVDSTDGLRIGDTIIAHRPSPANWIHDINMDQLQNPWTPGSKDINWDRIITSINGNQITVDAPLTTA